MRVVAVTVCANRKRVCDFLLARNSNLGLVVNERIILKLFGREIIFEEFQFM